MVEFLKVDLVLQIMVPSSFMVISMVGEVLPATLRITKLTSVGEEGLSEC